MPLNKETKSKTKGSTTGMYCKQFYRNALQIILVCKCLLWFYQRNAQ